MTVEPITELRARVDALNEQAWDIRSADPAQAIRLASEALCLSEGVGYLSGEAAALRTIAAYHVFRSELPVALPLAARALSLSRTLGDPLLEASVYNVLGLAHYFQNEFPAAMEHYARSLELYREAQYAPGISTALNNMGLIYHYLGDYQACIDHYCQSLEANRAAGEIAESHGGGMTLANIGRVYWDVGDYLRALPYLQECLAISRQRRSLSLESYAWCGLGVTYARLGRTDEAYDALRRGLTLSRKLCRQSEQIEALTTLSELYREAGRPGQSARLLRRALRITTVQAEPESHADLMHRLGSHHLALDARADARIYLDGALALAETNQLVQTQFAVQKSLADLAEREGDLAGALSLTNASHRAEKAWTVAQTEKKTMALLLHMEVDKAQQEAEIHRRKNVQMTALLEQLQAQAEELQAQAEELERQAAQDALTGLANRRTLEEWLARVFAQSRRRGSPLSIALADIDCFKQINDRFSHQVGDRVLTTVARLLQSACRASDIAARYGGEEFVLALADADASEAVQVCERLRHAVQAYDWATLHPALSVTISIGVSAEKSAVSHERLLSHADHHLYRAKSAGRNRVCA